MTKTYEYVTIDPGYHIGAIPPTVINTMKMMTRVSNRFVNWVQIRYDSMSEMQEKGIIYLVISHIAFTVFIISAIRAIRTHPGKVPAVIYYCHNSL